MKYRGFGRIHVVENQNKQTSADDKYLYIKVLNKYGEFNDLLLTEEQYRTAYNRALRNKGDFLNCGWFVKFWDDFTK